MMHDADDLVARAVREADPTRGMTIPMPQTTAAQLRERADLSQDRRRKMNRRKVFAVAGGTGLAALFGLLLRPSPAIAAPAMVEMNHADDAPPAASFLLGLAQQLIGQTAAPGGPGTYYHLQRWSMDLISPALELIAHDERGWWLTNRSGYTLLTQLPAQAPGHTTIEYPNGPPPELTPVRTDYGPGEFPTVTSQPPSSLLPLLQAQLALQEPLENGPQAPVRSMAAIVAKHHLGIAQRITALTALAAVTALRYRGPIVDRAGRPGFAISADSLPAGPGQTRDILYIAGNGTVLGQDTVHLSPPPGSSFPDLTVTSYTVHLQTAPHSG